MHYAVNSKEMKHYDLNTIEHFGVASLVLMERAALSVCDEVGTLCRDRKSVLVFCGCGNNGADGLAAARILYQRGYRTEAVIVGDEAKAGRDFQIQKKSLDAYGIPVQTFGMARPEIAAQEYDVIIDAVFGVGCDRVLEGPFADAVKLINACRQKEGTATRVVAVDLPSGINADNGECMGNAVTADVTVTFNFAKIGHLLYPGAAHTGKLVIRDIGITEESFLGTLPGVTYYRGETAATLLPKREPDGNKGSFGRILVIAGSPRISGAAILCAETCYRAGAGMVRVLTAKENRDAVMAALPEALLDTYDAESTEDSLLAYTLDTAMAWASGIVMGPGLGTSDYAAQMVSHVLRHGTLPLVLDADALNLIAANSTLRRLVKAYGDGQDKWVILTPHIKEFSRLVHEKTEDCREHLLSWPGDLAKELNATVVCKDARSVIAAPDVSGCHINVSGNSGMATAGSGDVLAGLLGALTAGGMGAYRTACAGCYLHGLAGDLARAEYGEYYMLAGDIIRKLPEALQG